MVRTGFRYKSKLLGLFIVLWGLSSTAQATPYYAQPDFEALKQQKHVLFLDLKGIRQTTDYTCGPSSTLAVLRFFGKSGDEMTLAKEMQSTHANGTPFLNLVKWFQTHGFTIKSGENGTLAMLIENLRQGHPTIVGWIDWGGHYVVCVGYDDNQTPDPYDDTLIFADSADFYDGNPDGLTWMNAKRFEQMWMVQGYQANHPWIKGLYMMVIKP